MVRRRRLVREAGGPVRAGRPVARPRDRAKDRAGDRAEEGEGERVKIKGICKRDGREFFAEQVIDLGGECPWDGEPFNADYAATLVESLREAERLGSGLERALER